MARRKLTPVERQVMDAAHLQYVAQRLAAAMGQKGSVEKALRLVEEAYEESEKPREQGR